MRTRMRQQSSPARKQLPGRHGAPGGLGMAYRVGLWSPHIPNLARHTHGAVSSAPPPRAGTIIVRTHTHQAAARQLRQRGAQGVGVEANLLGLTPEKPHPAEVPGAFRVFLQRGRTGGFAVCGEGGARPYIA